MKSLPWAEWLQAFVPFREPRLKMRPLPEPRTEADRRESSDRRIKNRFAARSRSEHRRRRPHGRQ